MARRKIKETELDRAAALLGEGLSRREVARRTGLSTDTLARHFPPASRDESESVREPGGRQPSASRRPPDPPPKVKKGPARKATDEQLISLLSKAAVAPAIPMGLWVHCDFCAGHFAKEGPKAAAQLVELSKTNPALRSVLDSLYQNWERYAWASVLVGYLGVPILHHLAPEPIYSVAAPLVGLPRRNGTVPPHAPAPGGAPAGPPPAGNPFMDLDLSQMMAMARQFGLEVPDDILGGDAAAAPPHDPSSENAETGAASPADADSDSELDAPG